MKNALQRMRACATAVIGAFAVTLIMSPSSAEASCLPASLQNTLGQIRSLFGPVSVVSAHRPGARIAGSGRRSYHASCRAVDFNPPPGKYSQVVAWLRQNHNGGLGTYSCGMHHIHIDNGPHVRFHKCQGGGQWVAKNLRYGKSKRYAKAKSGSRYAYAAPRRSRTASTRSRGTRYAYAAPRGERQAVASTPGRFAGAGAREVQYVQRNLSPSYN